MARKHIKLGNVDFREGGGGLLLGKMPKKIRGLVIDVEGTLCGLESPLMRAKLNSQNRWLMERFGVSEEELNRRIRRTERKLKKESKRRIPFSQVVYTMDPNITGEEWNKARALAVPRHDFSCRLDRNPELEEVITDLTADRSRGVRIVFQTNGAIEAAETILKMLFGARILNHGMFATVGHRDKLSKPDPAFFTRLVVPELGRRGVALKNTVSIGDRTEDDGIAAIEAGIPAAIIVKDPSELLEALKHIRALKAEEST